MRDLLLFAAIAALVAAAAYFGVSNARKADEVAERVAVVERLLREFTSTIDGRIAEAVREGLEGLDDAVADKVLERLRREGPCLSMGSCGGGPKAPMESILTLFHENARLGPGNSLSEDSSGVGLTAEHEARLRSLADAFAPCAKPPGHAVEFEVRGHSSTAEFKMLPETESNGLNRDAANLRAKVVADRLERSGFVAKPKEWESYDAIGRPYLDSSELLSGETDQEALNRSVFIQVVDAGACDKRKGPVANP